MIAPTLSNHFKHTVEIQVRFSDVDMLGHVSNTVYQTYYDYGKLNYFDTVFGEIQWEELAIVGASIKIDYLKPIFLKSQIAVKTRVSHIGNKSISFEHCMVSRDQQEILSTCTAVLVCYAPKLKQSVLIPQQWRNNIIAYEGMANLQE